MLSLESLVMFVVYLVFAGLIFWMLNWLLEYCGVPEPFHKVGKVIIAVFVVLAVIGAMLSLVGHPIVRW